MTPGSADETARLLAEAMQRNLAWLKKYHDLLAGGKTRTEAMEIIIREQRKYLTSSRSHPFSSE